MSHPSKARIRRSFERAAATYDSAAIIQRRICQHLAAALPGKHTDGPLLDAGCGTGYALHLLHQRRPQSPIIALDLACAMLRRIDSGLCQRLAGDLEHLPLASHSIALYWSSLALQWCNLPRALGEARRVLHPAGHLAVASLAPGTFSELRQAFAGIDDYRHTLNFQASGEIAQLFRQAGFSAVNIENRQETLHYPDLYSLLRAVKAVGANQLGDDRRRGLMSRGTLARVEAAYETQRQPGGLPLTYDIVFIHAQP